MSQKYRIYQLDPNNIADKNEEDGVLQKEWYDHPELGECLFKESRPSQAIITEARTDWTEKVVNEIANVLDLPVAQYELASGYFNNSPEIVEGVVSLNCIPRNVNLTFTGQQLLSRFIDYDPENPSQYTIENVLKALDLAKVKIPSNWESPIAGVSTGAELFVGYILLDTFTNNSDRHDHNWGVMSVDNQIQLIPSFDHGLSLGSTDEDEDKLNISLSGYVNRYSQSCFQDGYNKVPNLTIFDRAARLYPDAAKIWQKQLALVTPDRINGIFDRIPDGRITPVAAKFAIDLLRYNRERIANLEIEPIRKSIPKKAPKKDRGGR
jgi:hypothetical protein